MCKVCAAKILPNSVSAKGISQKKATLTSTQEPRELTGVEPLCVAKGTEKNQVAARLDVRLRRPFLEDLGRSGRNKGSSTWKKVKV